MKCSGSMEALVLGLVRAARAHGRTGTTRRQGEEQRQTTALLDAIAELERELEADKEPTWEHAGEDA